MAPQNSLYIVVVGCGRMGSHLAGRLSREGHSVVVIDSREDAFSSLPAEFSGFRVEGDATEMTVLARAKAARADAVIAVTDNDNVNIMVAQIAATVLKVPRVIARLFDPTREDVYRDLGIETVCPTIFTADIIADRMCETRQEGRRMKMLVVGGGRMLYFLCQSFLAKGYDVTVINRSREECVRLARALKATVVYGDGSDPRILEEAGAASFDSILAATPNDEDNLVICQMAERRFGVRRALAVVNDPDNEDVFKRLGVAAISTTRTVAGYIEQMAAVEEIVNLTSAGGGKVNITEITLTPASPLVGRALQDAALPPESLIACVLRGDGAIVPHGSTMLLAGDRVILVTLPAGHGAAVRAVTGDER